MTPEMLAEQERLHDPLRKSTRNNQKIYHRPRANNAQVDLAREVITEANMFALRDAHLEYVDFLKEKIEFHRSYGGRFHNDRAAAYDIALEHLITLVQDIQ